jgi:hypothetical protein
MRKIFMLLSVPALLAGLSVNAWSQNIVASLRGVVTDPSGAVVPGATVVIHNDATNVNVRTVITDSAGSYDVTTLPLWNLYRHRRKDRF